MKTNLKFTFETGSSVPFSFFFYTWVTIDGNSLRTNLYSKPADAHLYLRRDSCHPPSCTKGLVKGELLRARRICSRDDDFKKSAGKMMSYFVQRGFSENTVKSKVEEVLSVPREQALIYKKRKEPKEFHLS